MSVERYRRQCANSTSFVAALAVNAALIAVIATSAPNIFAPPEKTIEGYNVPDDPPPPPPVPPKPRTEAETPVSTPIPVPDRVVVIDVPPPDISTANILRPITDPIPPDSVGGPIVVPKPAPVMVDAAPDPRARFQPDYPSSERRSGLEGLVVVRVLIGADGRVKTVQQVRAASAAFFEATRRQALARWRFSPATQDGIPVESWRTMTVRFVIEG